MSRSASMSALAVVVALCAAPAQAAAPEVTDGTRQPVSSGPSHAGSVRMSASPLLWATVNVCDTAAAPNRMGVRASMPGNGRAQRMWMRFSAQAWNGATQEWMDVASGRSPWVLAGSARYEYRQAGWTFEFAQPRPGVTWTLRGVVDVQWRARKPLSRKARRSSRKRRTRWVVARKRTLFTRSAVVGVDGGDPAGTSKALCLIS